MERKDWAHSKWSKEEIKQPKPCCENECSNYEPIMCPLDEPIISIGTDGHKLVIDFLLQCKHVYECDKYEADKDF